ncbi:MAG: hypothetical protein ACRC33_18820, partial [Gemmataceae bacterium]
EFPSMPVYRSDLLACRRDFGKVLGYLERTSAAADQFTQAIALGEKLIADHPAVLPYRHEVGLTYHYYADLLLDGPAPADSLAWYDKAVLTLKASYEQDPKVHLTRTALTKAYEHRAQALHQSKRYADALPDWDRCLELCAPEMRAVHRSQRADSQLRSGAVAEAIDEVNELATVESKNPGHWFNFARLYALASVKVPGKQAEYADRAVELLKKAVALGFKAPARLAKDADLAPLRGRDDFKMLLAELGRKPPPK